MVFGQWLTDSLDGPLGRTRGEGLVKWGFFMDHFLDTIFAGSVVIGYSFLAPGGTGFLFNLLLLVTMAMMALSFLSFGATNEFQIAHRGIGPTEIRISYLALNVVDLLRRERDLLVGPAGCARGRCHRDDRPCLADPKRLWEMDRRALGRKT